MKTFPALMKSMNDRVRPSDELLEDTKNKMRAALQAKEAPRKKRPVFRYSTALAGLALVLAGTTLLPHYTGSISKLPPSGNGVSHESPENNFLPGPSLGEQNPQAPNDTHSDQVTPNLPDSSNQPPKAEVQPPLQPPLPPEPNGNNVDPPNILAPGGTTDSYLQFPFLFYSKQLPTLGEIGLSGEGAGSASSSASNAESSSVPSSPSDAPVQSSGVEPPSGASHGDSQASETSDSGSEPSVPTLDELSDGDTASVVKVGNHTLYFQPISGITVSSWVITDPENVEEKQWTTEEAISYFGRDPQSFSLPQGMTLDSSDTYSVWLTKDGKPYYDSVGFEFYNGSSSLTITMSKMGIPQFRSITMLNQQGSVLNGVSMQIGRKSAAGQKDTYTAEFVSGGIGYQIISGNLSQREFITLLQSITS